jgi:hypothetical protein
MAAAPAVTGVAMEVPLLAVKAAAFPLGREYVRIRNSEEEQREKKEDLPRG